MLLELIVSSNIIGFLPSDDFPLQSINVDREAPPTPVLQCILHKSYNGKCNSTWDAYS